VNKPNLTAVLPSHMLGFLGKKHKETVCDMDTFVTLVIALGGIATGIGAIWTAVVTRRLARATE
jgi:hypothetical protein